MRRSRIHKSPPRTKPADTLIEVKPGVWMFTPDWAVKKGQK